MPNNSSLINAIYAGLSALVEYFKSKPLDAIKVELNSVCEKKTGNYPLHIALKLLIDSEKTIDIVIAVIKKLIELGADPTLKNIENKSALSYISEMPYTSIKESLLKDDYSIYTKALMMGVIEGNRDIVERRSLVACMCNMSRSAEENRIPQEALLFLLATSNPDIELLKTLIAALDKHPNTQFLKHKNAQGLDPICIAYELGLIEHFKLIAKALIDHAEGAGLTTFFVKLLCSNKDQILVQYLINNGVKTVFDSNSFAKAFESTDVFNSLQSWITEWQHTIHESRIEDLDRLVSGLSPQTLNCLLDASYDSSTTTFLQNSITTNNLRLSSWLINHGASIPKNQLSGLLQTLIDELINIPEDGNIPEEFIETLERIQQQTECPIPTQKLSNMLEIRRQLKQSALLNIFHRVIAKNIWIRCKNVRTNEPYHKTCFRIFNTELNFFTVEDQAAILSVPFSSSQGTLLHWVIEQNWEDKDIDILIKKGADISIKDSNGCIPIELTHDRAANIRILLASEVTNMESGTHARFWSLSDSNDLQEELRQSLQNLKDKTLAQILEKDIINGVRENRNLDDVRKSINLWERSFKVLYDSAIQLINAGALPPVYYCRDQRFQFKYVVCLLFFLNLGKDSDLACLHLLTQEIPGGSGKLMHELLNPNQRLYLIWLAFGSASLLGSRHREIPFWDAIKVLTTTTEKLQLETFTTRQRPCLQIVLINALHYKQYQIAANLLKLGAYLPSIEENAERLKAKESDPNDHDCQSIESQWVDVSLYLMDLFRICMLTQTKKTPHKSKSDFEVQVPYKIISEVFKKVQCEVAEHLLEHGATLEKRDKYQGWRIAHYAICANNIEAVHLFLKYNDKLDERIGEEKLSPLELAESLLRQEETNSGIISSDLNKKEADLQLLIQELASKGIPTDTRLTETTATMIKWTMLVLPELSPSQSEESAKLIKILKRVLELETQIKTLKENYQTSREILCKIESIVDAIRNHVKPSSTSASFWWRSLFSSIGRTNATPAVNPDSSVQLEVFLSKKSSPAK